MQLGSTMALVLLIAGTAMLSSILSIAVYSQFSDDVSHEDLIREFYEIENAVHVSPHGIRKAMDKNDNSFILVDLRSRQEYEKEHIKNAINIPAYSDPNTSAYGDVDRIVGSFKTLKKNNPGKDIIVYCYSTPCMTGRKVGLMLAEHGIYVKHLGIGWNEWRYYWTLWNHEPEWNSTNVLDYIDSTPASIEIDAGCTENDGEFGC